MASGMGGGIEGKVVFDVETQMNVEIREEKLPRTKTEKLIAKSRSKQRKVQRMGRELAEIIEHYERGDWLEPEQIDKYLKNPRIMLLEIRYKRYFAKMDGNLVKQSLTCSSIIKQYGEESKGNLESLESRGLVDLTDTHIAHYIISRGGINIYNYLRYNFQEQIRYAAGSAWNLLTD